MTGEKIIHPAGMFDATVVDHGIEKAGSGNAQIAVKFETEFGTITGWFSLSDKAAQYTVEKVINMGFHGASLYQLNDGECIRGNRCVITVAHDEYEGRTRAKVRFVNPEGWEGFEIKRDEAAAASAKRFDALLHKVQGSAKQQQAANNGDDIPF